MTDRTRGALLTALQTIAILSYLWAFCIVVFSLAMLLHNFYWEGQGWIESAKTMVVSDWAGLHWTLVSVPMCVVARGLHGVVEIGTWTWGPYPCDY